MHLKLWQLARNPELSHWITITLYLNIFILDPKDSPKLYTDISTWRVGVAVSSTFFAQNLRYSFPEFGLHFAFKLISSRFEWNFCYFVFKHLEGL